MSEYLAGPWWWAAALLIALLLLRRMRRGRPFRNLATPPARLASVIAPRPPHLSDSTVTALAAAWMAKGTRGVEKDLESMAEENEVPEAAMIGAAAEHPDDSAPLPVSNGTTPPQAAALPGTDPAHPTNGVTAHADVQALLRWGQQAARAGDAAIAHRLFLDALEIDPANEDAWLWLAGTSSDPAEAIGYLEFVLQRNPDNLRARYGLEELKQRVA